MKTISLLICLGWASVAYSQYTPTFSGAKIIQKMDSIATLLETDSVVATHDESGFVSKNYASGYHSEIGEDHSVSYGYTNTQDSTFFQYQSLNPGGSVDKEERQYAYVEGEEDGDLTVVDWIFQFKKGDKVTEVALNFLPVTQLQEGQTTSIDIYITQDGVVLRGTVSGLPYDAPDSETSFDLNIEDGKYTGQLTYHPSESEFTIQVND